MKIVTGLEEAKKILLKGRGLKFHDVPPQIRKSIEDIFGEPLTASEVVERILGQVQAKGDSAIYDLTQKLDRITLSQIEVPRSSIEESYKTAPGEIIEALTISAKRIEDFHQASRRESWINFSNTSWTYTNSYSRR